MRWLVLGVAIVGCRPSAAGEDRGTAEVARETERSADEMARIPVPGGPADSPQLTVVGGIGRLRPEEGILTVGRIDGAVGAEQVALVEVVPGAGFHVSTDYPSKLTVTPPVGVRVARARLVAGQGRQGNADAFSERRLAFAVKATVEKAGSFEVKGTFEFGLCEHDSCHSKTLPIAIAVAAK